MAIYENSRYIQTPIYIDTRVNTRLIKKRERASFVMQNCKVHEWCMGDTLDGVANRYYGISAFRWAILDANPDYRTEYDIKVGDLINIPAYKDVVKKVQ